MRHELLYQQALSTRDSRLLSLRRADAKLGPAHGEHGGRGQADQAARPTPSGAPVAWATDRGAKHELVAGQHIR